MPRLLVYAETDVFDEVEHAQPTHRRRQKLSAFISDLQDLKPGDYVVHVDHGIGTYNGITLVHDRECMVLLYHGGDRVYVPLERLDLIQKYSSTEGAKPQLDKLGRHFLGSAKSQGQARHSRHGAGASATLRAAEAGPGLCLLPGQRMAEGV